MADTQTALAITISDHTRPDEVTITMETFEKFPNLPIELRLDIWKLTIPKDRVVAITDRRARMEENRNFIGYVGIIEARYTVPAAMQACREARNEIKKSYVYILGSQLGLALPFNFKFDTLLMDGPDGTGALWSFEKAGRKNLYTRGELAMIHANLKHLAVSGTRITARFLNEIQQFTALATLMLPANPFWNSPNGPESFNRRIAQRLLLKWTEWKSQDKILKVPLAPGDMGTDIRGRSLFGTTSQTTAYLGSVPTFAHYLNPIRGDFVDYNRIDYGTVISFASENELHDILIGRTKVTLSWIDHPNHPATKNLPSYDVALENFIVPRLLGAASSSNGGVTMRAGPTLTRIRAMEAIRLLTENRRLGPSTTTLHISNTYRRSVNPFASSSNSGWQTVSTTSGSGTSWNLNSGAPNSSTSPSGANLGNVGSGSTNVQQGPMAPNITGGPANYLVPGSRMLPFDHVPGWQAIHTIPTSEDSSPRPPVKVRTLFYSSTTVFHPSLKPIITPMVPISQVPVHRPVLRSAPSIHSMRGVIEGESEPEPEEAKKNTTSNFPITLTQACGSPYLPRKQGRPMPIYTELRPRDFTHVDEEEAGLRASFRAHNNASKAASGTETRSRQVDAEPVVGGGSGNVPDGNGPGRCNLRSRPATTEPVISNSGNASDVKGSSRYNLRPRPVTEEPIRMPKKVTFVPEFMTLQEALDRTQPPTHGRVPAAGKVPSGSRFSGSFIYNHRMASGAPNPAKSPPPALLRNNIWAD